MNYTARLVTTNPGKMQASFVCKLKLTIFGITIHKKEILYAFRTRHIEQILFAVIID